MPFRRGAAVARVAGTASILVGLSPGVVWAAGAALEAEVGQLRGTMITVSDLDACGQTALSASDTTNSLSISLTVPTGSDYVLWMRVRAPASSDRAVWVAVDASGVFQDPEDLFDIHSDVTGSYGWRRVTRRGSGTTSAPGEDPRLLSLGAGPHTLEVRLRESDLLLDRLALSDHLDYVPVDCLLYADPPPSDGGDRDGGPRQGDDDRLSEVDQIHGVQAANCSAGQYYDLKRRACLTAVEPSDCTATHASLWASLSAFLLGRVRRSHRPARLW
jgi:hypothetical protein